MDHDQEPRVIGKPLRFNNAVRTTIDPKIQEIAEKHVNAKEANGSPFAHGVVVVEPRDTPRLKERKKSSRYCSATRRDARACSPNRRE